MTASHIFFLLLGLCIFSVSADVFVSIDCGSSELAYTDENLIVWSGDSTYIQNGISQEVPTSNSISTVMDTLRVFRSRNKNCYTIKADQGGRVLVRASFYYGNYDQKSSPPSFDLQFDGNEWGTVQTSIDHVVYHEATYVVKGKSISVCVAQTNPDQFPFISALEVRSLGGNMYNEVDANLALLLRRRVAYGTNQTIRYMADIYDRIWSPMDGGNGLIPVASDALLIDNKSGDNPPTAVLQNAVTTSSTSQFIRLGAGFPSFEVSVYINMYFSEVTQLDSTQKRSFMLFKGNESFSDPISPPYGGFTEISVSNITVSSSTTFSLLATSNSTLPPLINAMEVFFVSNPLTDGANSNDVAGLISLQYAFAGLQDWGGDPCLPAPYTWDWVNCSSDAAPRITALYLSSFDLSGLLPDISSMDALETIDLHNNSFKGQIPDFLGKLPNLKELNLADNQFTGPIPDSLSKKNGLKLVITGNPAFCKSGNSCQTTSSSSGPGSSVNSASPARPRGGNNKKKSKLPLILGTTIPAFIIIWAVACIFAVLHYKSKTASMTAVNTGITGGGTTPLMSPQMLGKHGQVAMNENKVVDKNQQVTSDHP